MSPLKAIYTIVLGTVTFAIIGTVIGGALGAFSPDYYRAVLRYGTIQTSTHFKLVLGLV